MVSQRQRQRRTRGRKRGGAAAAPGTTAPAPAGPTVTGLTYGQTAQQNAYLSRQAANQQQASLNQTGGGWTGKHKYMNGGAVADNAAPATMEIYSPPVAYKDNAVGGSSVQDVNKNATQSLVNAQTNAAYDNQAGQSGGGRGGRRGGRRGGKSRKCQHGCGRRRRTQARK